MIIQKVILNQNKKMKEKKLRQKKKAKSPSPLERDGRVRKRDPKTGRFSKSSKTISKPNTGPLKKPISFTITMKVTVGL